MNTVKEIATYCGSITTILALITIIVKPIRNRFVGWISKTSDKDNLNKKTNSISGKTGRTEPKHGNSVAKTKFGFAGYVEKFYFSDL